MLLAFIALLAMVDFALFKLSAPLAEAAPFLTDLSLSKIFGWIFSPMAWVMGVPWHDAGAIGSLIGTKLAVNEFLAYIKLGALQGEISNKAYVIGIYALCGFANLSSIGIQIGGIGGIAPNRRHDLARLGLKAMFVGALASAMTACLAGILIG
jgi:CNT family concentrative nucleoside transporter